MKTYIVRSALLSLAINALFLWFLATGLGWKMPVELTRFYFVSEAVRD